MEFRTMKFPQESVVYQIVTELGNLIERGQATYRHFVAVVLWGALSRIGNRVPINLTDPQAIAKNPELAPISDAFVEGGINHLIWSGGDVKKAAQSIVDEQIGMWMAIRSVELSDTPCWYRPSEDLIYTLAATRLSGVYAEDVRLPYPAFWLELPRGLLQLKTVRGWHDIRCLGLSLARVGEFRSAEFAGMERDRLFCVMVQEPLKGDKLLSDVSFHNLSFPLPTDPETTLEAALEHEMELTRPKGDVDLTRGEIFGVEVTYEKVVQTIFNISLGFILYLRERNAQVIALPPREKRKGKDRRGLGAAKNFLDGRTWLVGTKIRLDPEIKRAVREGGGSISHHHKTVVPGHSQRYRIGPRTDWHYEIRRKDPYVRGGDGPILGHSYEAPTSSDTP